MASVIAVLAHFTNLLCFFSGVDASNAAQGHDRAIAPRTPAMALASLRADAPARQASLLACTGLADTVSAQSAMAASDAPPRPMDRREASGELGMIICSSFCS